MGQRIWITCIPQPSNFLDYSRRYETVVEGLGPIQMQITSPNLTVGGHLHLQVYLPFPVQESTIRLIRLDHVQTTQLESRKDSLYREECTPERVNIANLRQDEVIMNKKQGGWLFKKAVRIASEDLIRPSTMQSSQAKIRIGHRLELTIKFLLNEKTKDVITYCAQWPIVLSSVREIVVLLLCSLPSMLTRFILPFLF